MFMLLTHLCAQVILPDGEIRITNKIIIILFYVWVVMTQLIIPQTAENSNITQKKIEQDT